MGETQLAAGSWLTAKKKNDLKRIAKINIGFIA
jgi:hypothetical protein